MSFNLLLDAVWSMKLFPKNIISCIQKLNIYKFEPLGINPSHWLLL